MKKYLIISIIALLLANLFSCRCVFSSYQGVAADETLISKNGVIEDFQNKEKYDFIREYNNDLYIEYVNQLSNDNSELISIAINRSMVDDLLVVDSVSIAYYLRDSALNTLIYDSYHKTDVELCYYPRQETQYKGEKADRPAYLEGLIDSISLNNAIYSIEFQFLIRYEELKDC